MCRTRYAFLFMLAIVGLACGVAVPSLGWAESEVPEVVFDGEPVLLAGVADDRAPSWSPDGSKIAFESAPLVEPHTIVNPPDIYVMNADGMNPINLTRSPLDEDDAPSWSPDGSKIAFFSNADGPRREDFIPNLGVQSIHVMNADGTNLIDTSQDPYDDHNLAEDYHLAWSPDSSKIAFTCADDLTASGTTYDGMDSQPAYTWAASESEICVMNADGTNRVRLTHNSVPDFAPAWSPDGSRIAFSSRSPSSFMNIYVMNADGTAPVRLPEIPSGHHNVNPRWSPNGSKIAFSSGDPGNSYTHIYVMNADGTAPVRLPEILPHHHDLEHRWSPDGSKIAFHTDSYIETGYHYTVAFRNADGTNPILMTQVSGWSFGLTWSPDGSKIAFYAKCYKCLSVHGDFPAKIHIHELRYRGRGSLRAMLLNLSPWQAWVHLYCLKDRAGPDADPPAPCAVTFECNGQSGEPVTWPVEVAPKTIFTYWPNKTATDGTAADLQAALIAAGKLEEEARRRTTCEVFSPDPLTVRGYTRFGGQPTFVPVAEPARPEVSGEPGERRRQATLPNLSPWQAWVHLYCLKDRAGPDADPPAPCAVTFECNGQSGEPVTWPVEVAPKTIFTYWPNKTVDGLSANLQDALIAAGKPPEEARRRTTCEVSSADPIAVRGYTRFGGQPTLVPVTAY